MKTLKIRIAVAILPDGEWNSCGYGRKIGDREVSDKDKMDIAVDTMPDGEERHFIEAEIPLPETKTIKAVIVA